MGDFPRIHHREEIVRKAEQEVSDALFKATKDLTDGETLRVVVSVLGSHVGGMAKFMIRAERHPDDPDQPGGLE